MNQDRAHQHQFKAGDWIVTRSRRKGEIQIPPGGSLLPNHTLIRFPSGDQTWILAELIELDANPEDFQQNPAKKRTKGGRKVKKGT